MASWQSHTEINVKARCQLPCQQKKVLAERIEVLADEKMNEKKYAVDVFALLLFYSLFACCF